ncbi:hypothetical protein G6F38_004431 [Rhizopus arrhizus]|nr:hypothetical protein G6F38_004431 [Rhizopus arrhizus]
MLHLFTTSFKFCFKDGQGNIYDENGNDFMEIDDKDSFKFKKLNSYAECIAIRAKINMKATAEDMVTDESNGFILETKPSRKEDNGLNSKHSVKDGLKAQVMHLVNTHPKNSATTIDLELKLLPGNVQR